MVDAVDKTPAELPSRPVEYGRDQLHSFPDFLDSSVESDDLL